MHCVYMRDTCMHSMHDTFMHSMRAYILVYVNVTGAGAHLDEVHIYIYMCVRVRVLTCILCVLFMRLSLTKPGA